MSKEGQAGNNSRDVQKGLSCGGWIRREHQRGYESSPNTSEFSDVNDLSLAKNAHLDREVERLREILSRNPQAWQVVEAIMLAETQEPSIQRHTTTIATGSVGQCSQQLATAQDQNQDSLMLEGDTRVAQGVGTTELSNQVLEGRQIPLNQDMVEKENNKQQVGTTLGRLVTVGCSGLVNKQTALEKGHPFIK
jgi:hypothetical protein